MLHDVRDPGNAGTLIRTRRSGGLHRGRLHRPLRRPVQPQDPARERGSHLSRAGRRVDVRRDRLVLRRARRNGSRDGRGRGRDLRRIDFTRPTLVVIGNEADGLDAETLALCDGAITIEMVGASESLNAGVAGSLIAFEAFWRREGTEDPSPPPSL